MDAQKELQKWIKDYRESKTEKEIKEHKMRFDAFLKTLTPQQSKAFSLEFLKQLRGTSKEIKKIKDEYKIKRQIEGIQNIISLSYIAKEYFNKSRTWLYQRINGNIVNGKPANFTQEEIKVLKKALLDISNKIKETSEVLPE